MGDISWVRTDIMKIKKKKHLLNISLNNHSPLFAQRLKNVALINEITSEF